MSRGLGRVERIALHALRQNPDGLCTMDVCMQVGRCEEYSRSIEVSTRRALNGLVCKGLAEVTHWAPVGRPTRTSPVRYALWRATGTAVE